MQMWVEGIAKKVLEYIRYEKLTNKELAIEYAMHFIGLYYRWGGDDPSGFDCSGFVVEVLKAAGIIPRNADYTAKALFAMFQPVTCPYRGCLVFYHNNDNEICHVELMLNDKLSIGASGGGPHVKTQTDAIKYNAFIKIRNHKSRGKIVGYTDPFFERS